MKKDNNEINKEEYKTVLERILVFFNLPGETTAKLTLNYTIFGISVATISLAGKGLVLFYLTGDGMYVNQKPILYIMAFIFFGVAALVASHFNEKKFKEKALKASKVIAVIAMVAVLGKDFVELILLI